MIRKVYKNYGAEPAATDNAVYAPINSIVQGPHV